MASRTRNVRAEAQMFSTKLSDAPLGAPWDAADWDTDFLRRSRVPVVVAQARFAVVSRD